VKPSLTARKKKKWPRELAEGRKEAIPGQLCGEPKTNPFEI